MLRLNSKRLIGYLDTLFTQVAIRENCDKEVPASCRSGSVASELRESRSYAVHRRYFSVSFDEPIKTVIKAVDIAIADTGGSTKSGLACKKSPRKCFLCREEVRVGADSNDGEFIPKWRVVICNRCLAEAWNGSEPMETLRGKLRSAQLIISYNEHSGTKTEAS